MEVLVKRDLHFSWDYKIFVICKFGICSQRTMQNKNSNIRVPVAVRALRFALRGVNAVSSQLAGRWAYRLWFGTHRFTEPRRETKWREQAEEFTLPHEYGPLALYSWGDGPTVLLVHGWNGRGTQLGGLAMQLAEAGYRAIAFDAPGHGRTPGNSSNIFRIIDAVEVITNEFGPLRGVVTHSFGAMVITRALREQLTTDKVVCINPATEFNLLKDTFYRMLRLPTGTRKVFEQLLEYNFDAKISDVISADVNAKELSVPALIIHDKNDSEVPWQQGELLAGAWPGARFLQTEGLGHTRILRDRPTIQAVVNFINNQNSA